jgi:hypothetical protein
MKKLIFWITIPATIYTLASTSTTDPRITIFEKYALFPTLITQLILSYAPYVLFPQKIKLSPAKEVSHLQLFDNINNENIRIMALSRPKGEWGSNNQKILFYDPVEQTYSFPLHPINVYSATISARGNSLAYVLYSPPSTHQHEGTFTVYLTDPAAKEINPQRIATYLSPYQFPQISLSPQGDYLAMSAYDVYIYSTRTQTKTKLEIAADIVSFSPRGNKILSQRCRKVNLTTTSVSALTEEGTSLTSQFLWNYEHFRINAAFSSDGEYVIGNSKKHPHAIVIRNAHSGKMLRVICSPLVPECISTIRTITIGNTTTIAINPLRIFTGPSTPDASHFAMITTTGKRTPAISPATPPSAYSDPLASYTMQPIVRTLDAYKGMLAYLMKDPKGELTIRLEEHGSDD